MKLIKRLKAIVDLIEKGEFVIADIGADHGYLSKMLIDQNKAKKVIATDISKQSLQKTDDLVKKYKMQDQIETRVGDGLNPVKYDKLDYVVIAGMGGYEIIKILSQDKYNVNKFILQPSKNQNVVELRKFLNNNFFFIEKDFIIEDNKRFYNTILCYKTSIKQNLNFEQIEFGLTNFDLCLCDFKNYLKSYIESKQLIVDKNPFKEEEKQKIQIAKALIEQLY